jgi:hypothetical protein
MYLTVLAVAGAFSVLQSAEPTDESVDLLQYAHEVWRCSDWAQAATREIKPDEVGSLFSTLDGRSSVDRFGIEAGRAEELVRVGIDRLQAQFEFYLETRSTDEEADEYRDPQRPFLAGYGTDAWFWYTIGAEYEHRSGGGLRAIEARTEGPNPFLDPTDEAYEEEWQNYYSRIQEAASERYFERGCDTY